MLNIKSLNPRFFVATGALFALVGCATTDITAQQEASGEEVGFKERVPDPEEPARRGIAIEIG
jgi:hypothetical protein